MATKASRQALRVALTYVGVTACWILFSDEFLKYLIGNSAHWEKLSILKGWLFVVVTGCALYVSVRYLLRRCEAEIAQRAQAQTEYTASIEKLRQSEEQLRLVMEGSADGFWDWNIKTGFAQLSPRYWQMTGYPPASKVANLEFFKQLVHPDDWNIVESAMNEHLAGKTQQSLVEYRMILKDGTVRWIWGSGKVVERAPDGTPLRMAGTISDITERKQMESELRKARTHYKGLLDTSADGIHVFNSEGELIEANAAFYRLLGFSTEDPPKLKIADWDLRFTSEEIKQVIATFCETPSLFETRYRRQDGSAIDVEICALRMESQGQRCYYASARDITERKQAERKLRESEQRYRRLFELESDAIVLADGETRQILDVNRSAQLLYGYTREEFLHLRLENVSAEPEESELSLNNNDARLPLRWHRKKNGERFAVEITASNLEHQGRSLKLAAVRDITGRILAEQKLRESEEKFSKMFQASPVPVSLSTLAEGRYLNVNEEFLRMVQHSRDEVIGHTAVEVGLWLNPKRRDEVIRKIMEFGSVRNLELLIRTGAGQDKHILWSAEAIVVGGESCILGTSLDITERKSVEEKMRESEERYRQLFELESDAVVLIDCQTHRFVDVNQSAQRLYGYTRDEFLELVVEDVSAEPEVTHATVASGAGFIPLRWHRKKGGERFAVEITANQISYQGRRTELATLRDITVRQHVMEMLSETTDQLLEAQRVAGLGSYVFDVTKGIWTGSEVLNDIFGLIEPGGPHSVTDWLDIVHPDDRGRMQDYLSNEVIKNRTPFDRVYRIIRVNDQRERWVHGLGKLIFNDDGQILRMVGVIQDVTERKRDEERMHVQLSALTAAANAIVITDRNGKIEWVNPAFSRLTGYSANEAIGSATRILNSGQHPPAFFANMWVTILTGNVWHGEIINRRKDGQIYTEETTITPVRGADDQIAHFVAIKQDVTEQRHLEKRMQQAQKMEAIGTLAGGIAHDFNNILAAMFGYAYLLQQDTEGNPAAQENIEEILKATGRAKDLVQQILTFSRQREQKPQVIQLCTVVKEAIKFLRASLPAQIKIQMNLSPDAPTVLADPTQIYQVVINLATNALHAMEGQAGQLTVILESIQPDSKLIYSHPELRPVPYARLTVADTGHGMDAKTLERIFEPFFTTKPVGKGTGLGLAVVHGIVESHGGVITVESSVGRGTTFHLYFPGQKNDVATATTADKSLPLGGGQRILLLDDEPALTAALQRLLVRLNYQVTTSNSARETVNWCRRDPTGFDLVITDLTMPEMTGLEVARQLRDVRPDLPVILASGFSADLNRETLEASGICELLEKPISRAVLANVVQRVLASRNNGIVVISQ